MSGILQAWLASIGGSSVGDRGVFAGGLTTPFNGNTRINVIDYISIATTGNATDFGDLTQTNSSMMGCGSLTRGVFTGGNYLAIRYITFATTGNTTYFGNLIFSGFAPNNGSAAGDATRGLFLGSTNSNIIQYITYNTLGNATDFGDLLATTNYAAACASPTRVVLGGGGGYSNVIQYVTTQTAGNSTDFGDLVAGTAGLVAFSSSTIGVFAGGAVNGGAPTNVIQYVTIATTGNATDFGDLINESYTGAGCSSNVRGVVGGGTVFTPSTAAINVIEYVTIATTGNSTDFGDLTAARTDLAGASNSNGGVQ